jgi:hypothetical protein
MDGICMYSLQEILEIENDEKILSFYYNSTDLLMWPTVRTIVLRSLIDQLVFKKTLCAQPISNDFSLLKRIKCGVGSFLSNIPFLYKSPEIVFLNSGITNILRGQKYYNRVTDDFAGAFEAESLLLENHHNWHNMKPRTNKSVMSQAAFWLLCSGFSKFKKEDTSSIDSFVGYLQDRIETLFAIDLNHHQIEKIRKTLSWTTRTIKFELFLYKSFFKWFKPKVVFFEDGCYGGYGHLIRMCKQLGIKTAELQHGLISKGHDAYNFSLNIKESKVYKEYLPDYFLGYGQWWLEQINADVEKVIIGNPHYENAMKSGRSSKIKSHEQILILSNRAEFDQYITLSIDLQQALGDEYEIFVRPHPSEKGRVVNKVATGDYQGINIDLLDNLYESFANTDIVVAAVTTALFEAIGQVDEIYVLKNNLSDFYTPNSPFEKVDSIKEIKVKLRSPQKNNFKKQDFWADDPVENYKKFMLDKQFVER